MSEELIIQSSDPVETARVLLEQSIQQICPCRIELCPTSGYIRYKLLDTTWGEPNHPDADKILALQEFVTDFNKEMELRIRKI